MTKNGDTASNSTASRTPIVWEWHVWDHLIQDFDPSKANFGVVADNPQLIDINAVRASNPGAADWLHANAVDYNAGLDQVMLGVPWLHEFWVIDHSTTTAEAAGHTGGDSGKGGDLLYRWGNPQIYDRGLAADQTLFNQHHPHWIEPDLPGEGNILVFNNGRGRPAGDFSTIDEIVQPVDVNGNYTLGAGLPYGPAAATWVYTASPDPFDFFSGGLSGPQRLPNGNTLVLLFELLSSELTTAIRGGRPSDDDPEQMFGDVVKEIAPDGSVVYQWKSWEHLDAALHKGGPSTHS